MAPLQLHMGPVEKKVEHSDRTPWLLRTGFFKGVQKVLKVVEGGILHAGPPCSSFTWLNRGTSKRCTDQPEGDRNEPTVVRANLTLSMICVFWI